MVEFEKETLHCSRRNMGYLYCGFAVVSTAGVVYTECRLSIRISSLFLISAATKVPELYGATPRLRLPGTLAIWAQPPPP